MVTIAAVLIPAVAVLGVTINTAGKMESQLRETKAELKEAIQRVDLNSAARREESTRELVRLHEIQSRQIEDNREDIRELTRRVDTR